MRSALYEGTIRHRRFSERRHEFRHRIAMAYVDLDELPGLLGGRLLRSRPGLVRFRRRDYLGADTGLGISEAARAVVERERGSAPQGPVRMLAHLRTFGHCFNPVSFYYLFDAADETVEAIVAEVTNTPWGERHSYVLDGGDVDKAMHVSPFMGMSQHYTFRAPDPGPSLSVHIESSENGERVFDATLGMRRKPLTRTNLARQTARYPAATVRMLVLIYAHALALRVKGVTVKPHPETRTT